jgi:hypothetical protein
LRVGEGTGLWAGERRSQRRAAMRMLDRRGGRGRRVLGIVGGTMLKLRVLFAMSVLVVGCGSLLAQAPAQSQAPAASQDPTPLPTPQNVLKIKTKSNIKNDRTMAPPATTTPGTVNPGVKPEDAAKIKSHSNQANNRAAQPAAAQPMDAAKVKSHSNHSNNRVEGTAPPAAPAGDCASAKPH